MKSKATLIGIIVIVNACIWGFTMIMSSRALSGTDAYEQIQTILSGGAGMSLLVVGGGLAGLSNLLKSGTSKKEDG